MLELHYLKKLLNHLLQVSDGFVGLIILKLNNKLNLIDVIVSTEKETDKNICRFGNLTLKLGERLMDSATPCDECTCSTPPEITCITMTCPAPPVLENAICEAQFEPGKCCPDYSCVSSNPPSINVCQVTID